MSGRPALTFQLGGCREAWLNVTYNYAEHYGRVIGDKGIRTIYGMSGTESIPCYRPLLRSLATKLMMTIGSRRKATRSFRSCS